MVIRSQDHTVAYQTIDRRKAEELVQLTEVFDEVAFESRDGEFVAKMKLELPIGTFMVSYMVREDHMAVWSGTELENPFDKPTIFSDYYEGTVAKEDITLFVTNMLVDKLLGN